MRASIVNSVSAEFFMGELHAVRPILDELESRVRFEYFSYVFRTSTPVSCPRVAVFYTYPEAWVKNYRDKNYAATDPVLRYNGATGEFMIWTDESFAGAAELWKDAHDYGINIGATMAFKQPNGLSGLLSIARSAEIISKEELKTMCDAITVLETKLREAFYSMLLKRKQFFPHFELHGREKDILKYTADGKTAEEIASLLYVTPSTVNFHIKNSMVKLDAKNKTEAAIKAALWGLL